MPHASGGERSDLPACGLPASFSVHLASSVITPAGSVHKSKGDNVGVFLGSTPACVCRADGDVICVGHDLNRCSGWWYVGNVIVE